MAVDQALSPRVKLFIILFFIAAAGLLIWQYGNPVTLVTDFFSPSTPPVVVSSEQVALHPPLDPWSQLTLRGRVPIEVGDTGRNNPYIASGVPADNDARRYEDLLSIRHEIEKYHEENGDYPSGTNVVIGGPEAACLAKDGWLSQNQCTIAAAVLLPVDPGGLGYTYTKEKQNYKVVFSLDKGYGDIAAGSHTMTISGVQ